MKYSKFSFPVKNPLQAFISNFFQVLQSIFWFWKLSSEPHRTNTLISNEIKLKACTLKSINIPLDANKQSGAHERIPP